MFCIGRILATLAVGCVTAVSPRIMYAQDYPTREITMVVPFTAGGPTDVIAHIMANKMAQTLGQPIRVENIAGAGGTTGSAQVARAPHDGYTLIAGHMGTHAAALSFYPNLPYHPEHDFEPVSLVAGTPIVIVARKDFSPHNLREFIAYVRANTDRINMAHAGVGSVSYTSCLLLNGLLGIKPTGVPFGGAAPAMAAVASGQVDYMCDQIVNVVPRVAAGAVKAYAVALPERSPALPEVPTTFEAGRSTFEIQAWSAIFAPKGTPAPILARLSKAISLALDDGDIRDKLQNLGAVIPSPTERGPAALAILVRNEIARWTPILQTAAN